MIYCSLMGQKKYNDGSYEASKQDGQGYIGLVWIAGEQARIHKAANPGRFGRRKKISGFLKIKG